MSTGHVVAVVASLHRRIDSIVPVGFVPCSMIVGSVQAGGHLSVGVELSRRLSMKSLLLVTMRAWRAGRRRFVVHVGLTEMIAHVVHDEGAAGTIMIRGRIKSR